MIANLREQFRQSTSSAIVISLLVFLLAFVIGRQASEQWLSAVALMIVGVLLLLHPNLGLPLLVVVALLLPVNLPTGTAVVLNPATFLLPVVLVFWLWDMLRRGQLKFVTSSANRPLALFLAASLLSLVIGRATWNPLIPVSSNFLVVQLAQWAIFVLSALAFWLTANLVTDEKILKRLVVLFLLIGGSIALIRLFPSLGIPLGSLTTVAIIRAPFWVLLAALTAGQLFWNRQLPLIVRILLAAILIIVLDYVLTDQRDATSNWVGIGAALGVILWLRFPRLRWFLLLVVMMLTLAGILFPTVYDFAGGDAAWERTGGSRVALIQRVVEVTLRNPITGLGPAAYRPYANATPLQYLRAVWISPNVSSHNNYIDLFAHGGLLGLALFAWFVFEIALLGQRVHSRYKTGFVAGYVNGMLAAGVGALVLMLFADWILPFVYNIGFPGFQASMLMWMFMGALVALDQQPKKDIKIAAPNA